MSKTDIPSVRVPCVCRNSFDESMDDEIFQVYGECQTMLSEVGIHVSGRPLEHSVREAVDEIKAARGTWQPMSTAPKNGDQVVAWGFYRSGALEDFSLGVMWWSGSKWEDDGEVCSLTPVYWLPMPCVPDNGPLRAEVA